MITQALVRLLLLPSFASGVGCTLVACSIFALRMWDMYVHSSDTIADAVANATTVVAGATADFLAQPWLYYVLLVMVAVAVGMLVALLLQVATGVAFDISETIDEAHTSGQKVQRVLRQTLGQRILLRIIVAIVIILYWQLTIVVFVPFCVHVWDTNLAVNSNWLHIILAGAGLWLVFHVQVVLLRLLFLRPRLFGGRYSILAALQ